MKKKQLSTRFRIALGQISLLVSLLLTTVFLGLFPDRDSAVRIGRVSLAEGAAAMSTEWIVRNHEDRLQKHLGFLVERNADLLSIGVRKENGEIQCEVGEHQSHWQPMNGQHSIESQLQVPIYKEGNVWGTLEFRYKPTRYLAAGWLSALGTPWIRFVFFVSIAGFVLFYFYLGRMLKQLDPSKAIPPRVRSALDTMAEGLIVLDLKKQVVLANSAFAALIDKDPDDLLGFDISSLDWQSADHSNSIESDVPWQKAIDDGEPQRNSLLKLNFGGQQKSFFVNCSPVLGSGGKFGGVLVSFDDVTQLETKKVELSEARDAAEAANRSKSEFLANMSHEIRTPMTAILGFSDVLRRGYAESPQKATEYLNTIHSSGQHLLGLINDILDLSKVESGRLETEQIECSPYTIVSEVLRILQVKADEKSISLSSFAETKIPKTIVSDPGRLKQIVTNLVGNAIKFTSEGGVRVGLRMTPENQFAIDVIDSGIGMTDEQMEKIFAPFSQADTSTTRRFGGTGLGLSISKRFAEALNGRIDVSSETGRGSKFTVVLNVGPPEELTLISADEAIKLAEPRFDTGTQWRFDNGHILVVDDAKENRDLVTLVLQDVGLKVSTANNGKQGMERALAEDFDLVLMDMQMPVMDGYTATRNLRSQGYDKPILALTAHAMKGSAQECLDAGCTDVVTKPIDFDVLQDRMAKQLPNLAKRGEGATSGQPTFEAPTSSTPGEDGLIHSTLPDAPEFNALIGEFVDQLFINLDLIDEAIQVCDFEEIKRLAHWLKGSGGTVGFDELTKPARKLEVMAIDKNQSGVAQAKEVVQSIAQRLSIRPDAASLSEPAEKYPSFEVGNSGDETTAEQNDEKLTPQSCLEVVESSLNPCLENSKVETEAVGEAFKKELACRFDEMARAWHTRDYSLLAGFAHWLRGTSGTVGYDEFSKTADLLEIAALEKDERVVAVELANIYTLISHLTPSVQLGPSQTPSSATESAFPANA